MKNIEKHCNKASISSTTTLALNPQKQWLNEEAKIFLQKVFQKGNTGSQNMWRRE